MTKREGSAASMSCLSLCHNKRTALAETGELFPDPDHPLLRTKNEVFNDQGSTGFGMTRVGSGREYTGC